MTRQHSGSPCDAPESLGRPLVVWQDGKVVKVPPEEIVVEETDDRAA